VGKRDVYTMHIRQKFDNEAEMQLIGLISGSCKSILKRTQPLNR